LDERTKNTPLIAAASGGASFLVKTRLLFNLEQVPSPAEVPHLDELRNAPSKRKRKTPPDSNI